jgi:flagellar biosynthesis/type III secretory pathway protein FliH
MKRFFVIPALAFAALALSVPAHAQSADWRDPDRLGYAQRPYLDARRAAYDNGFREGLKQGEKDGRRNNVFEFQDERTFQRADKGYHREFGPLERYRQSFRSGYSAGYSDGYQRYGRNSGYGAYGRQDPRRDSRGPGYPNTYPGYPQQSPGYRGYGSAALQNGASDGYEKGVEDARRNRSYDPRRHEWYRSGDRHYDGRFGPREQYKDVYRQGFMDGYDRGYREGRYR